MVMWERLAGPAGGDDAARTPGGRPRYATHGKRPMFTRRRDDGRRDPPPGPSGADLARRHLQGITCKAILSI